MAQHIGILTVWFLGLLSVASPARVASLVSPAVAPGTSSRQTHHGQIRAFGGPLQIRVSLPLLSLS